MERAAAAGSVITESWARAAWGWLLLRVDPATALPVIEAGLAEARRIDYPIAVAVDLRSLAYARLLLGDLPGAVEAAGELLDDLLERGALSNARLLVDVTAVLAHRCGHPDWASLATTARALPITTLTAAQYELVPLPDVEAPVIGRHHVIVTVRDRPGGAGGAGHGTGRPGSRTIPSRSRPAGSSGAGTPARSASPAGWCRCGTRKGSPTSSA